jgi:hypothetical protein
MKFTKEKELHSAFVNNDKKRVTKFLWWPITVYNHETRWLERATMEYRVVKEYTLFYGVIYYWKPVRFIDKSE